jgi:uncharacterized protein
MSCMRVARRCTVGCIGFWALGALPVVSVPLSYEDVRARTVRLSLSIDRGAGLEAMPQTTTGLLIDANGTILTVRHLVPENWQEALSDPTLSRKLFFEGLVGGAGNRRRLSLVEAYPGGEDAMVLRVQDRASNEPFAFFLLSEGHQVEVDAGLAIYGFPGGILEMKTKKTSLSRPCTPAARCEVNVKLDAGFSGGAVLANGILVGLVATSSSRVPEESAFIHVGRLRHWLGSLIELPVGIEDPKIPVPRPTSPPDGSRLSNYPRIVELGWTSVAHARSYVVEIEIEDPEEATWHPHPFGFGRRVVDSNTLKLDFVGSQPGRWRVAARLEEGTVGDFSNWSYFDYTPDPAILAAQKPSVVEMTEVDLQVECNYGYGSVDACLELILRLAKDNKTPESAIGAVRLAGDLCSQGVGRACYYMATFQRFGRGGLFASDTEAARYLRQACDLGLADACNDLGLAHQTGRGVAQDLEAAAASLQKACDRDMGRGCYNLGLLEEQRRGEQHPSATKAFRKAILLFRRDCDAGDFDSCGLLGYMYAQGLGVGKDPRRARELFQWACEKGSAIGCDGLESP